MAQETQVRAPLSEKAREAGPRPSPAEAQRAQENLSELICLKCPFNKKCLRRRELEVWEIVKYIIKDELGFSVIVRKRVFTPDSPEGIYVYGIYGSAVDCRDRFWPVIFHIKEE